MCSSPQWQKQEVRTAYATGHDYFAKFGLGQEPEPVEAPPMRYVCKELGVEVYVCSQDGPLSGAVGRMYSDPVSCCLFVSKHKRMSFDIPKTDRNVANLIAQLTTATEEELLLMSKAVQ